MRHFAGVILCLVVCLSTGGCISQKTVAVDDTNQFQRKTVALTARPRAAFTAGTAGKAMFGLLGAAAMAEAGSAIVQENGIANPATAVGDELLAAAEKHYGVVKASMASIPIKSTDPAELAAAATGADFVLDVEDNGQSFFYYPTSWTHYWVATNINVRVVDVHKSKLIAEGHCAVNSQQDPNPPTKDELLANKAARLKSLLDSQAAECAGKFKREVLKITD